MTKKGTVERVQGQARMDYDRHVSVVKETNEWIEAFYQSIPEE